MLHFEPVQVRTLPVRVLRPISLKGVHMWVRSLCARKALAKADFIFAESKFTNKLMRFPIADRLL